MQVKKLSSLSGLTDLRPSGILQADDLIEASISGTPGVGGFSINDGITGWASIKLKISQLRNLLFSSSTEGSDITPNVSTAPVRKFVFSNQYLIINVNGNNKYIPLYNMET